MFENLTDGLQQVFRRLRGYGRLSESNISDAMDEIRTALLEADVNYQIVKEFIAEVREHCLGAEVLKSVTPGQQVVKIVNDCLVGLMGESSVPLDLGSFPSVIMVIGLHGSGKTTTAAKLAVNLKKQNKKSLLVAGDIYRPAAIDQLEVLGNETGIPVYTDRSNPHVSVIAKNAVDSAVREGMDAVIIDTAGRLQIDDQMVQELVHINYAVSPKEILLVVDAALGQEAVSVADHFHKALGITGVILTKLDGDARGGAALSLRRVTNCPIKFVGVGEKVDDLEAFHPDRMASRILGMGDIVSLVEKAAEEIDEQEAARLEEKLRKQSFDFDDFLQQMRQMRKMGGLDSIIKMLPGGGQLGSLPPGLDSKKILHMEAAVCSMTKEERVRPEIINFSRRKRIAGGSGTSLEVVGQLIKQFSMMRKMMKKTSLINKLMSGSSFGDIASFPKSFRRGSNIIKSKKRKKWRRR